jgi:two-component system phosphate regulon response regulator PhoB
MSLKRVLVVDDESSIRSMLRFALETEGLECLEAADITNAYGVISDQLPDMVLLDWMMPGGNGVELLAKLKREEATQSLPVIMLTAKAQEDNIAHGLALGADDYLTKPFSPKELLARMRAVC